MVYITTLEIPESKLTHTQVPVIVCGEDTHRRTMSIYMCCCSEVLSLSS